MAIDKSEGVTESERFLAEICEKTFLKLWSYPNPYKDDGKELCDLLVVFEGTAFIFFDREKLVFSDSNQDSSVQWSRWKRKVIDAQVKTAAGAKRYIESGRAIYLDHHLSQKLPIHSTLSSIHKIVVAHGAAEACKAASDANVYGSLAICYVDEIRGASPPDFPFFVRLGRTDPVHVFDTHNLPIILGELDTVWDLSDYLEAKNSAISAYDMLMYCGEEDLLAHYFLNYDEKENRHYIGTKQADINGLTIGEGEWKDFVESDVYGRTKRANENSYLWDRLIQKTSENALNGVLLGDSPLFERRSALHEMAKEPRFSRRALSDHMLKAIENFPDSAGEFARNISLMPSITSDKRYLFLQVRAPEEIRQRSDFREKRQIMLEVACGVARNRFPDTRTMVGIAVDAPKYTSEVSEDFLLLDCRGWTEETERHYEDRNQGFGFLESGVEQVQKTATRFVPKE